MPIMSKLGGGLVWWNAGGQSGMPQMDLLPVEWKDLH